MIKKYLLIILIIGACCSCGPQRPSTGKWTTKDSYLVAMDMSNKISRADWLNNHVKQTGEKPVLQVGYISIQTNGEVIDSSICTDTLVESLLKTKKIRVSADKDVSRKIRSLLNDQDNYASLETKKKMFREIGADFFLTGSIRLQEAIAGRKRDKVYVINMKIIHIESSEISWIGNYEISKHVTRPLFH